MPVHLRSDIKSMRAKLNILSALAVSLVGGVLATGCQTYDFEPVEPLAVAQTTESRSIKARAPKPNLMLLVDTSGSMKEPAEPSLEVCKKNGVSCGESTFQCNIAGGCDTRWSALQKAMTDFLKGTATSARIATRSCSSGYIRAIQDITFIFRLHSNLRFGQHHNL